MEFKREGTELVFRAGNVVVTFEGWSAVAVFALGVLTLVTLPLALLMLALS